MTDYRIISADTHIVEPPDLYSSRVDPKFKDRAPRIERKKTPSGKEYDAWIVDGSELGGVGLVAQVGQRFEDPSGLDFRQVWDDVRRGAFEPEEMVKDLEMDGVWGGVVYPSEGLVLFRIPDSDLMSALWRASNDWIAEFCKGRPDRIKGVGSINVDDVDEACDELERCSKLGLVGALIATYPLYDRPYRDPMYERLWGTAQDLDMPLILHDGCIRGGIPGSEETFDLSGRSPAARSTVDRWIRYSLADMIFAGVFDRFTRLKVGVAELELSWIPWWLQKMDQTYAERPEDYTQGWRSKEGLAPSDYWRRNMFATFIEDAVGVRLRDIIGVDNVMWGSDFPHAESAWPESKRLLDKVFAGVPEEDKRKMTSDNAARLFKFEM